MGRGLKAALILSAILQAPTAGQQGTHRGDPELTARVDVVAFSAKGRFLGAPDVVVFQSDHGLNLAARFRDGAATGIPYGVYRIEGRLPWYFSDVRYVWVYQPKVTIVLGLEFDHEGPRFPPTLSGRVAGPSLPAGKSFVEITGVYEHVSIESAIGSDGSFSLGGVPSGLCLLLVVDEHGILASRTLTLPYTGPPLEIEIKSDQPSPAGKVDSPGR
jgi:hypothetical protein